jgi:hypothetical protein
MQQNPNQRISYRWLGAALARCDHVAEAQNIVHHLTSMASAAWLHQEWVPWMREVDHVRLLDGLRKGGWQG